MSKAVNISQKNAMETTSLIKRRVIDAIQAIPQDQTDYETASRNLVRHTVKQVLSEEPEQTKGLSFGDIMQSISDDLFGLGCIERFLRDKGITDILVEDTKALLIYGDRRASAIECFNSTEEVRRVIDRITGLAGKRVDASTPFCDCGLDDGSRCHIIVPPASDRIYMTIRKHDCMDLTINDWIDSGIMPLKVAEILESAIAKKMNILISGGTGAGKTTLLNTLTKLFGPDQIVVTLEDTPELSLKIPHVRRLLTRDKSVEGVDGISYGELLKNALRMNPDRLIMGEVRDSAAYDLLHALNIGHKGSISTLHANSCVDALWRLENLAIQGSTNLRLATVRRQIARVIDLVVQLQGNDFVEGAFVSRRFVEIAKVNDALAESGEYNFESMFRQEISPCC
jgi:pilus assembly protein CpaF